MDRYETLKQAIEAEVGELRVRADRCSDLVDTHPELNSDGRLTAKATTYRHAADRLSALLATQPKSES